MVSGSPTPQTLHFIGGIHLGCGRVHYSGMGLFGVELGKGPCTPSTLV